MAMGLPDKGSSYSNIPRGRLVELQQGAEGEGSTLFSVAVN